MTANFQLASPAATKPQLAAATAVNFRLAQRASSKRKLSATGPRHAARERKYAAFSSVKCCHSSGT